MIKVDEKSNAQGWELEVLCKNKKYLNAVVKAILKRSLISFEVVSISGCFNCDNVWEGRYTVFLSCSWFNNLADISKDLAKIERKLE